MRERTNMKVSRIEITLFTLGCFMNFSTFMSKNTTIGLNKYAKTSPYSTGLSAEPILEREEDKALFIQIKTRIIHARITASA
jgi:hypothetical protein